MTTFDFSSILPLLLVLPVAFFYFLATWKIFTKAGQPGWAFIIPIYNYLILLKIIERPWWWMLLSFVPLLNFIIAFKITCGVARAFGKSTGFGIGLIFLTPIFLPILAFGDATYKMEKIADVDPYQWERPKT